MGSLDLTERYYSNLFFYFNLDFVLLSLGESAALDGDLAGIAVETDHLETGKETALRSLLSCLASTYRGPSSFAIASTVSSIIFASMST